MIAFSVKSVLSCCVVNIIKQFSPWLVYHGFLAGENLCMLTFKHKTTKESVLSF